MDAAGLGLPAGSTSDYGRDGAVEVRVVGAPAGGAGEVELLDDDGGVGDGLDGSLRGCDNLIPVIFKYFRTDSTGNSGP